MVVIFHVFFRDRRKSIVLYYFLALRTRYERTRARTLFLVWTLKTVGHRDFFYESALVMDIYFFCLVVNKRPSVSVEERNIFSRINQYYFREYFTSGIFTNGESLQYYRVSFFDQRSFQGRRPPPVSKNPTQWDATRKRLISCLFLNLLQGNFYNILVRLWWITFVKYIC